MEYFANTVDNEYNPIRSVNGRPIPPPSSYQWGLQDISDSDAGRTEDTKMHKNMLGQAVKLELSWRGLKIDQAPWVLQAFQDEYVTVEYLDALVGDYVTKVFYTGDRTGILYNCKLGFWEEISFNIIEQKGKVWDQTKQEWKDTL